MKHKILVIEDDKVLQNAMLKALETKGYEVAQAFDCIEAEEKVRADEYAVILLDLILPKGNGWELLTKMTEGDTPITKAPILVTTIVDSETSVEECMAQGAAGYLIKSENNLEDIVAKIEELLK